MFNGKKLNIVSKIRCLLLLLLSAYLWFIKICSLNYQDFQDNILGTRSFVFFSLRFYSKIIIAQCFSLLAIASWIRVIPVSEKKLQERTKKERNCVVFVLHFFRLPIDQGSACCSKRQRNEKNCIFPCGFLSWIFF